MFPQLVGSEASVQKILSKSHKRCGWTDHALSKYPKQGGGGHNCYNIGMPKWGENVTPYLIGVLTLEDPPCYCRPRRGVVVQ